MFSFGSSKQSSQSTSEAASHAENQASALDTALSRSNAASLSRGGSQATGQSTSTQSIAFEDLLRSLFGGATDATAAAVANAPLFQGEAAQLFSGGLGFLDQLQQPAGADYLRSRITGPDAAADAQIGALGANLGKFFDERLMPAITSRGVATGTLGGSRQGVSIGRAAGEVGTAYSTGVAQILANSQSARDAAAQGLNASSINAAGTGLNALPSLLGLAGAGFNAGLSPYTTLAGILGGPTVLTQGQSTSQSTSEQIAQMISEALSQSFGESQSSGFSDSESSSQSTSKGKSFNFGFSPAPAVG